jgi:hypothetical protein
MHSPTTIRRPLVHVGQSYPHHRTFLRDIQAHLRGWERWENVLTSVSLAILVAAVLALLYQAMAI